MRKPPRVPEPAAADLIGEPRIVQVNHCRRPSCGNFGVPARHQPQKPGPSPDRDPAYVIQSTAKGQIPSLRCKACGENPPIKSNASIVEEIERLADADGLWTLEEAASCPNPDCANHGRTVAGHGKLAYRRRGRSNSGTGQRHQCKACGRKFELTSPVRLHDGNRRFAADVFSRIANKSPGRGAVRGAGLASRNSYYAILRFIHARCRAHSGAVDRALIDGRLTLPGDLVTRGVEPSEHVLPSVMRRRSPHTRG